MTTKNKKDIRQDALDKLRAWHEEHDITDFPQRLGISTNEKKFREVSFRTREGVDLENAEAEDFIVSTEPVYGWNNTLAARVVTYRVWRPSEDRKVPGFITVRFSLHNSVVGLVKVGPYFVAVEHDNFPLQEKTTSVARMFGVSNTSNLDELGVMLLEKEFPFFKKHVETVEVTQLGDTIYQDPTTRREETIFMLVEVGVDKDISDKEVLANIIDHRNKEMILHHIFTEDELKNILDDRMGSRTKDTINDNDDLIFCDQFSTWCLASYFYNK